MMVATIACQSVGMLLAAVIALMLLKNMESARSWRLFLAAEGVIALLFFFAAPVGTRQSALVGDSREICRGGAGVHPDHA